MSKVVVILLVSTLVAMVVMFIGVPLHLKNAMAQYANPNYNQLQANSEDSYNEKLNSLLERAGDDIQDKEISQFYQKLIQDYDLTSSPTSEAQTELEIEDSLLPDFQRIFSSSMTLPFQEAAKNIEDKELAEVYRNLVKGMLDTTE